MTETDKTPFWRRDAFAVLLATVSVLFLYYFTSIVGGLEQRYYDFASTSLKASASENVAVIAIDNESIENLGHWPWRREVHAKMIEQLHKAGAKVVGYQVFFSEADANSSLPYFAEIEKTLEENADQDNAQKALSVVHRARKDLDDDAKLEDALRKAGNVVLPALAPLGEQQGRSGGALPKYVTDSMVDDAYGVSIGSVEIVPPIARFAENAEALAHLNVGFDYDEDGVARYEVPFVNYYGKALPSMAVQLTSLYLNLQPSDIHLEEGSLQLGKQVYPTDGKFGFMLPVFSKKQDGKSLYTQDSFYDVLTGKLDLAKYRGKIVLVGPTADGVGAQMQIPGMAGGASAVDYLSEVTSSLLQGNAIENPYWSELASFLLVLLVAAYLFWLLPRMSPIRGAVVSLLLAIGLLLVEYLAVTQARQWAQMVLPTIMLITGYIVLTTKRFLVAEEEQQVASAQSSEANRMMGITLQGQGRLDEAFDRFRMAMPNATLMENIYSLALDFERKRQFNKSQLAYEFIAGHDPGYKDIQKKINRAKSLTETSLLGLGNAHAGGALVLDADDGDGSIERPMLGRYQVEKELGKGAMGVVYMGRDPKIGRVVAIKTLALQNEFDGEDLDDARARFFREAESAGRLQHPDIVTIYDAGEEHDLAYIAMEFLRGRDLEYATKAGELLPIETTLSICKRVALALAYAHDNGVIHRDIKPANIMYEPEEGTLKVTDFGIARIAGSSKTKTGMVLGTPSFMSPELIAGKLIDGRTDLYSLGVMLYQMLAGRLPFEGDSLATLMYKITQTEPDSITEVCQDIPPQLEEVLRKSLAKKPADRYQDGVAFANAIDQAVQSIASGTLPDTSTSSVSSVSSASPLSTAPISPHSSIADAPTEPQQLEQAVLNDAEGTQSDEERDNGQTGVDIDLDF